MKIEKLQETIIELAIENAELRKKLREAVENETFYYKKLMELKAADEVTPARFKIEMEEPF